MGRRVDGSGLCDTVEEGVEEGSEEVVENGLAEDEVEAGFAPNSVSPRLTAGFNACGSGFGSGFSLRLSLGATTVIRKPRNALTLPSLRRHVFLRHVRT